jgi:hypothetical protein
MAAARLRPLGTTAPRRAGFRIARHKKRSPSNTGLCRASFLGPFGYGRSCAEEIDNGKIHAVQTALSGISMCCREIGM